MEPALILFPKSQSDDIMSFLPATSKAYLTLQFTDNVLRITRLDPTSKSLTFFSEIPLPPNLIVQSEVKDIKAMSDFLLKVKNQLKLGGEFVIVGISDYKAINHTLVLPALEISEINQALRHEAATFLPFSYKDEYLDWEIIEEQANGNKKILLSAVPKSIIDGYTLSLSASKLYPVAFETTSLSLFRMVPENDRNLSFILDVGAESSVLLLVKDGSIEMTSTLRDLSTITADIAKIRDFYISNLPERPLNIYLSGKGATNILAEMLKNELKLNPIAFSSHIAKVPNGRSLELASLLSLAAKKVLPPTDENTINLLPENLTEKYKALEETKEEKKAITIFNILLFMIILVVSYFYNNARITQQKLASQLTAGDIKEEAIIKAVSSQKINLVINADRENKSLLAMMNAVTSQATGSVKLLGLNYDTEKKEITLIGQTSSRESLLNYKTKLENQKLFKKVNVPLSSLETNNLGDFRVILIF